jgi:hypothetical protein
MAGLFPVDDKACSDQEVNGFHGVLETDGVSRAQNQDVFDVENGPDPLDS